MLFCDMKAILLFLLFIPLISFSQIDSTQVEIVEFPDEEAQFPGGSAAMMKFINEHIEYPGCLDGIVDSRIYLSFVVQIDGSITNIECRKGKDGPLCKSGLKLVGQMPKWIPARNNGKPVASRCILPIIICLE